MCKVPDQVLASLVNTVACIRRLIAGPVVVQSWHAQLIFGGGFAVVLLLLILKTGTRSFGFARRTFWRYPGMLRCGGFALGFV